MYHVALPSEIGSGENKGKPNIVEIKSAKLLNPDKTAVEFKIPAERFKYPQFGPAPVVVDGKEQDITEDQAKQGIDEAIKDAGGVIRFLENYNDATRTAALNKGKGYIRTKETGNPDEIVEAGLKQTSEFTWAAAERITNKQVREEVESLVGQLESLSKEELAARLLKMVGKK